MANLDINNTFKRTSNTYRLVITNDDTYDEVTAVRFSRNSVYIGISISFILLVGLTIALIAFTPLNITYQATVPKKVGQPCNCLKLEPILWNRQFTTKSNI